MTPNTDSRELKAAAKKTANYLYVIKDATVMGEIDQGLYQAIAMLRQLINEEFKPQISLSSQFIYDIINPAILAYTANKQRDLLVWVHDNRHKKDFHQQLDVRLDELDGLLKNKKESLS